MLASSAWQRLSFGNVARSYAWSRSIVRAPQHCLWTECEVFDSLRWVVAGLTFRTSLVRPLPSFCSPIWTC